MLRLESTVCALSIVSLAACQVRPPDPVLEVGSQAPPAVQDESAGEARRAAEDRAPAPVDVEARLAEARGLLDAGQPYDALAVLDEVHRTVPQNATAWSLRGRTALAAAAMGRSAADFYADALVAYQRALALEPTPADYFGASRAARMNLDGARAVEFARQGLAALSAAPRDLSNEEERIVDEALLDAFIAQKQAGEEAGGAFDELEQRLSAAAKRAPSEPWAWTQLANLFQWQGLNEDAAATFEHVLAASPEDPSAHDRYVALARAAGGSEAVLDGYGRFLAAHPDHALGTWYLAAETFNQALGDLKADRDAAAGFRAAEAVFQRCRELEPAYLEACKNYETVCRAGVGWALYGKGDLEGAKQAFVSMGDVVPGGLAWKLDGSLDSGEVGLQYVADKYARKAPSEFALEGKVEAAEVFDLLRAQVPTNVDYANNAGLFHRDACVVLQLLSQRRARTAEGFERDPTTHEEVQVQVPADEAARLRSEAEELHRRALEQAMASYRAYQAAVKLNPDDVRLLNDAALVMVYHVRQDVDEAQGLLEHAIELGARQTAGADLSEEERDALLEAWGDAHQNMGVLHLTLRNDPATARRYFQKAIDIGPAPRIDRAWVREAALPACDKMEAGDPQALEGLDPRLWLFAHP